MLYNINEVILVNMTLIFQLVGLLIALLFDTYMNKRQKKLMLLILFCVFTILIQNHAEYYLSIIPEGVEPRLISAIYGYSVRPLVIYLFIAMINQKKELLLAKSLVVFNFLLHFTAVFSPIVFTITEDNHFKRGALGNTSHIVSAILLGLLLYYTIKKYDRKNIKEALLPVILMISVVFAVYMDTYFYVASLPVTYLTIAMVSDCLFYYIWLHLQFVKRYEASLMKEQQIDMMMSQIKPHFLYNTLTTIQALCLIDPKQAADLTQNFAKYLRRNMNVLSSNELIPLIREIEHTRIYCDIEKVRFSNIDVKYDIEDSDFLLPALTIQPMVENAIKHGIRGKQDGLVEIFTEKIEGFHKIVIRDNGKGFDSDKPINEEEHIGLANVKSRVEKRCNGTFTIKSKKDEGCEVTILIPE